MQKLRVLQLNLQIELSCRSNGMENIECAILPPINNNEATPDDATVITV